MSYKDIDPLTESESLIIQSALSIAKGIMDQPGMWYSQQSRWGPNSYDCSSFVYTVWQKCFEAVPHLWARDESEYALNGGPVTKGLKDYANQRGYSLSTLGLRDALLGSGFYQLDDNLMRESNPAGLMAGDVLLMRDPHEFAHTALVYGRDKGGQLYLVEAGGSASEGPSARSGGVGFAKYWGKNYWQYAFRTLKGYENPLKALRILQAKWYVQLVYKTLLGRQADEQGLWDHVGKIINLTTGYPKDSIYSILADIMGSPEYRQIKYTNEQVVTQLYKIVLGRSPDPIGLNSFVKTLKDNPESITINVGNKDWTVSARSSVLYSLCASGEALGTNGSGGIISNRYGGLIMYKANDHETGLPKVANPLVPAPTSKIFYKFDDGTWKQAKTTYVHNGSVWKQATGIFIKQQINNSTLDSWVGG